MNEVGEVMMLDTMVELRLTTITVMTLMLTLTLTTLTLPLIVMLTTLTTWFLRRGAIALLVLAQGIANRLGIAAEIRSSSMAGSSATALAQRRPERSTRAQRSSHPSSRCVLRHHRPGWGGEGVRQGK